MVDDVLIGQKAIMAYMALGNWKAVRNRILRHKMPVRKIVGRWEASRALLDEWHRNMLALPDPGLAAAPEDGEPAKEAAGA